MDFFDSRYCRVTKKLLTIVGLWPYQTFQQMLLFRTLTFVIVASIAIPEIIKLVEVWGDYDTVVECMPTIGLRLGAILKWTTFIVNRDKIKRLSSQMQTDWKSRANGDGNEILKKYTERGRFFSIVYAYYMYISTGFYVGMPIVPIVLDLIVPLNESRPPLFPFKAEYFFDEKNHFTLVVLHGFLVGYASLTVIISVDSMYSVQMHYVSGMFAELGNQLENCVVNKDDSLDVNKIDDACYYHLIDCIKKHKKALEFCTNLESMYSKYFVVLIGLNVILISFTGVQAVMRMYDFSLAFRYISFTLGQIVHVLLVCWNGQLLIDGSAHLHTAVYYSNWYKFSYRSRRLLLQVMMNTARPIQLSAGKFFFISLETFSTILRTAMSYFTLLSSVQ